MAPETRQRLLPAWYNLLQNRYSLPVYEQITCVNTPTSIIQQKHSNLKQTGKDGYIGSIRQRVSTAIKQRCCTTQGSTTAALRLKKKQHIVQETEAILFTHPPRRRT